MGAMIDEVTNGDTRQFPHSQYHLELSAPIKLYLRVESNFEIQVTSEDVTISFNKKSRIKIGARSHHERPAATITTTKDPEGMMQAVSYLGSALKTTTCERSYPTLRGHPPEISVGNDLQVPPILDKPETGVTIEVPNEYRSIYVMSPLAYYLGAELILGKGHKLKTEGYIVHDFDKMKRGLESGVEQVLKQCFFFDCITRTEGYYPVSLHEREQIESTVELDFSSLYGASIQEQIRAYLSVPFDTIAPHLPQWKQTAYVECDPDTAEVLPFLLHDLSSIRSATQADINRVPREESSSANPDRHNAEIVDFSRQNGSVASSFFRGSLRLDRSGPTAGNNGGEPDEFVQVPETESFEQVWVGTGIPIGASKAMIEAFENRLDRSPVEGDIQITVVVNDEEMAREGTIADEVYGSRERLPFVVSEHRQLTTRELRDVLETESDFLHYIGHIDKNGFECVDGQLDVTGLDTVAVDTFLLNACSSYQQAISLIKSGAIAGIATLNPVLNSGAERIGKALARLLNLGFPLVAALHIARSKSIVGDNYVIIGDGGMNLTQSKSGTPSLCDILKRDSEYTLSYTTYLTRRKNIGSITIPFVENNEKYFLTSGSTGNFRLNINDILRFLSKDEIPVRKSSTLYWSDEISVSELTN